ncbi:MAG TPA: J domain-containing protein [Acidimicrobiales bacterium]|nr:J domain-containing protein [Acidimicrobiales bacterium]
MPAEDFYAILGVARTANEDEIKRAYLKLARELHPDKHAASPEQAEANEERFKTVNRAYETLKDPERRRQYDMFGPEGARAGDPFTGFSGAGLGDIFDAFFGGASPFGGRVTTRRGGPMQGENVEAFLELDFPEAVLGAEKEVNIRAATLCETCSGTGARPGTTPVTCSTCNGLGEVRRVRQSLLGQMVTSSPCGRCGGTGEEILSPCTDCRGQGRRVEDHTYTVEVPPGVDDGSTLRLTGRGAAGPRGGPSGDLYLHLKVRPHPELSRDGDDLRANVHTSMAQAALGTSLKVESLDGSEEIAVQPGCQSGQEVRLRGKGVPHLQRRGRGDLVVTIVVDTPDNLTPSQEELLRRFAAERGEEVSAPEAGLMSRIRSAFK